MNSFVSKKSFKRFKKKVKHTLQPGFSVSRDYYLFALFILLLTSIFIAFSIKTSLDEIQKNLYEKQLYESAKIESLVNEYFNNISTIGEYTGRKIVSRGENNLKNIHYLLKRRFTVFNLNEKQDNLSNQLKWPLFHWINSKKEVVVSSAEGILKKAKEPISFPMIYNSIQAPWKLYIDPPIYKTPSNNKVIPTALSVYDRKEKYIGTIASHIDAAKLQKFIVKNIDKKVTNFLITDLNGNPILNYTNNNANLATQKNNDFLSAKNGLLAKPIAIEGIEFITKRQSNKYNFIIMTGLNSEFVDALYWKKAVEIFIEKTLFAFIVLAAILVFYWFTIKPIKQIIQVAENLLSEDEYGNLGKMPKSFSQDSNKVTKVILLLAKEIKNKEGKISNLKNTNVKLAEEFEKYQEFSSKALDEKAMFEEEYFEAKKSKTSREKFLSSFKQNSKLQASNIISTAYTMLFDRIKNRKPDLNNEIELLGNIINHTEKLVTNIKDKAEISNVNLSKLIDRCITHQKEEVFYYEKDFKFEIKNLTHNGITDLFTDEEMLEQAITALIYKSICDYPKSHIKIYTSQEIIDKKPYLNITIEDDGNGASFKEDSETQSTPTNGTDLSFQDIEKTIKILKGKIAHKEQAMTGSEVTIKLPYNNKENFVNKDDKNIAKNKNIEDYEDDNE